MGKLWNYIVGYVVIKLEGLKLEGFFQLLKQNQIKASEVKRVSYTEIRATLSYPAYRKLLRVLENERYTVTIMDSHGAKKQLDFFYKRPALWIGILVCLLLLYASTFFVWEVRLLPNEQMNEFAISQQLEDLGVQPFMLKSQVDLKEIKESIVKQNDEVAYCNPYFKGTTLMVELVKSQEPPQMIDDTRPKSLVASKTAVVQKITSLEGRTMVSTGDIVRKGDELISGILVRDERVVSQVSARGSVLGKVVYTASEKKENISMEQVRTGEVQEVYYLQMGGVKTKISGEMTMEEPYEVETSVQQTMGENTPMPMYLIKESYYKTQQTQNVADAAPLKVELEEKAFLKAQQKVPESAEILGMDSECTIEGDTMEVKVTVYTLEEIAQVQYLQ